MIFLAISVTTLTRMSLKLLAAVLPAFAASLLNRVAAPGLVDRSCRPRRSPGATPRLLVSWVETLRR